MGSEAYVRLKYGKSTVKYSKSTVLYGNFILAPTVYLYVHQLKPSGPIHSQVVFRTHSLSSGLQDSFTLKWSSGLVHSQVVFRTHSLLSDCG